MLLVQFYTKNKQYNFIYDNELVNKLVDAINVNTYFKMLYIY